MFVARDGSEKGVGHYNKESESAGSDIDRFGSGSVGVSSCSFDSRGSTSGLRRSFERGMGQRKTLVIITRNLSLRARILIGLTLEVLG